jgi:predicted MFS family arabinose efflux permease
MAFSECIAAVALGARTEHAVLARAAMWVLVVLAVASALAVWRLPAVRAPRLSLRERGKALADPRVVGTLAGTVTVLTSVFLTHPGTRRPYWHPIRGPGRPIPSRMTLAH